GVSFDVLTLNSKRPHDLGAGKHISNVSGTLIQQQEESDSHEFGDEPGPFQYESCCRRRRSSHPSSRRPETQLLRIRLAAGSSSSRVSWNAGIALYVPPRSRAG